MPRNTSFFYLNNNYNLLSGLIFILLFLTSNTIFAAQARQEFTVSATIEKGCILGASGINDVSSFGTINFGSNISSLFSPINVTSSQNAGSITLKCTPSTPITIAINTGSNATGNISSGRQLKLNTGSATLPYQLYQNTNRTTIWGDGSNGGSVLSFTSDGTVQVYNIYATLFSSASLPAVGQYNDTVTVTITY